MRIGKIANSAKYRMDEQFVNYQFIEPNFGFLNVKNSGEVQNLEWSNVERPIFRNFQITNIKIAKMSFSIILFTNLLLIIIFI